MTGILWNLKSASTLQIFESGGTSRFPGTDFSQVSNKGACQTSEPENKESLPYATSLNATAEIAMSSKMAPYEFGYRNLGIVEIADGT